jgi:hypothetical protein
MDIVIVGIDLGKNSSIPAGVDATGRVVLRRRMRRETLEGFVGGLERCVVAMEGMHPRCAAGPTGRTDGAGLRHAAVC